MPRPRHKLNSFYRASSPKSRRLKLFMGIATLWVAVVAIVLAGERFFPESHETTFSNYEAARDALPLYAPRSAVDIRVRSMTESSARWLSFRAPIPDIATMLRSCARVAENALEYTQHPPPRWWPTVLAPGEKKGDPQYEYYRCEQWPGTGRFHARRFMAVDAKRGQVF